MDAQTWECTGCQAEVPTYSTHCAGAAVIPRIVVNDIDGRWSNSTMADHVHEARITPTVGAGREVMLRAGENATSSAHTFEGRVTQESGGH